MSKTRALCDIQKLLSLLSIAIVTQHWATHIMKKLCKVSENGNIQWKVRTIKKIFFVLRHKSGRNFTSRVFYFFCFTLTRSLVCCRAIKSRWIIACVTTTRENGRHIICIKNILRITQCLRLHTHWEGKGKIHIEDSQLIKCDVMNLFFHLLLLISLSCRFIWHIFIHHLSFSHHS